MQTFVAGKVVDKLDDRLDADIQFEKIHLKPFTTLVLKNIKIIDRNPQKNAADPLAEPVDTFFRADYIIAKFTLQGLFKQEGIHLDKAYINGAQMNLVIEDKEDEGDGDTSTDNLSRIFRLQKPDEPKRNEKEIFHINDVKIIDMGFSMKDYGIDQTPFYGGINWNDLDVRDIDLTAKELQFKAGIMSGDLKSLSFNEKSGYICNSLTGSARVGRGKTIINDLLIKDPWSEVRMPLFMMSYDNVKAFQDFISQVRLDADIRDTRLDFQTITYFAPQLEGNRLKASLDGNVSGYVDNFNINRLRVATQDGGFSGTVTGTMTGIPDIENTRLNATISKSLMTIDGLGRFLSEWMPEGELDLSGFAKGILFSLDGKVDGLLNSFDAEARISSLIGSLAADVKVDNVISEDKPIRISGDIDTDDLDIGRIIGTEMVRQMTMSTKLEAELSEVPSLSIRDLNVSRLNINSYDYGGIRATGKLQDNLFNGWITCHDPNLYFMLKGAVSLVPKGNDALYGFEMSIGEFVLAVLPYTVLSLILVIAFAMFTGNEKAESKTEGTEKIAVGKAVIYAVLFAVSLLTVLDVIPYPITLAVTVAAVLISDRKTILKIDYSLLLTFVFLFIFIGNLGNIAPVSDFLRRIVVGNEVIAGIAASQVFSNVPAALLLSGFTDNAKDLLVGVNLGGLGTLIASMASLISFKLTVKENVKAGKYLLYFTVVNVIFLAANIILWLIIR